MFDNFGVIMLIAVILFFGFLTTRAWKLKNGFLKWTGVFLTGLLTMILAAVLGLALTGFSKLNAQYDNSAANITVTGSTT